MKSRGRNPKIRKDTKYRHCNSTCRYGGGKCLGPEQEGHEGGALAMSPNTDNQDQALKKSIAL